MAEVQSDRVRVSLTVELPAERAKSLVDDMGQTFAGVVTIEGVTTEMDDTGKAQLIQRIAATMGDAGRRDTIARIRASLPTDGSDLIDEDPGDAPKVGADDFASEATQELVPTRSLNV